jgi:hypothetical protein
MNRAFSAAFWGVLFTWGDAPGCDKCRAVGAKHIRWGVGTAQRAVPTVIRPSRHLAFCIPLQTLYETDGVFPLQFWCALDSLNSNKNASYAV